MFKYNENGVSSFTIDKIFVRNSLNYRQIDLIKINWKHQIKDNGTNDPEIEQTEHTYAISQFLLYNFKIALSKRMQ